MDAVSHYRQVLRTPGAPSLTLLGAISRMTNIPFSTLITVVVFESTGSWVWAGIGGGLSAVSAAVPAWGFGLLIDSFGVRRILALTWPGTLLVLLVGLPTDPLILLGVCLLAGIFRPPMGTTIRSAWVCLLPDPERRAAAYSLDATLMPISGALGALLGALLLALFGIWGVLAMIAGLGLVATIGLLFNRAANSVIATGKVRSDYERAPLGAPVWSALMAAGLSWSALTGSELIIGDLWGGEVMLLGTGASLVSVALGAAIFASRSERPLRSVRQGLLLIVGAMIAVAFLAPVASALAVATLALLGLGRGLIASSAMQTVSEEAPEERMSEAMGLYGAATLIGAGGYRPLAAILLALSPLATIGAPIILSGVLALTIGRYKRHS
jgi:MFS family permease